MASITKVVAKAKEAAAPGLQTRQVAQRLLSAVIDKKTSLDGLTDNNHGHPLYLALSDRDRALTRAILGASLRHYATIEAALNQFLDRPLPANARSLRHLFHVGASQILYLDVPDHAAIDLAVCAAKSDPRNQRFSGLVNAILRKFARARDKILSNAAGINDSPAWFASLLKESYGKEKAAAIIAAQYEEPALDLTVKQDPNIWAQTLGGIVLPNGTVRIINNDGPITALAGFDDGAWWVQDVAASLPALLMGEIKGCKVADLCAAPGGKTAQLAAKGADVTAFDISANRLKRLKANMARLQLTIKTVGVDIRTFEPETLFDAVLLDAPCSSTGTVRRHPDVLFTKGPEDIATLAKLQRDLLDHAVRFVRPSGTIVFSNCSLAPEEGEDLVRDFLSKTSDVVLSPIVAQEFPGLENIVTKEGFLRSTPADLPHENPRLAGMDGFFAARFIKR